MFEEVKCKACKTILPSASYHRTSGEKSCKENLTSSLPRYLRWDYVPVTMGNHIREGDLHDIRNDSIHVLIFRRPLQEMGWWRWKLYMKQIQRLATPCLYKWIFCWLLKWKTHLGFFTRGNWRKMGTDWTSWDQIYGDIRCGSNNLVRRIVKDRLILTQGWLEEAEGRAPGSPASTLSSRGNGNGSSPRRSSVSDEVESLSRWSAIVIILESFMVRFFPGLPLTQVLTITRTLQVSAVKGGW